MKKIIKIISAVLCFVMLLSACQQAPDKQKKAQHASATQYTDAVTALNKENKCTLNITKSKSTTIGTTVIEETVSQILTYQKSATSDLVATVNEIITIGSDMLELSQTYLNGNGYMQISGGCYTAPVEPDAFMAQFVPAVLLDTALYKSITSSESDGITMFSFSEATAAESWAAPANTELQDAHGTATLDNSGKLVSGSYHIFYTNGPAAVAEKITVNISIPDALNIPEPDAQNFTQIQSYLAPKQLETACLYLKSTDNLRSDIQYTLNSDALSVVRDQLTCLTLSGKSDKLKVDIASAITQKDYSNRNSPITLEQSVHYANNTYSTNTGGVEETIENYPVEQMQEQCDNLLLGSIPSISQLSEITSEEVNNHLLLQYRTSNYLSDTILQQASDALCGDPSFISGISNSVDQAESTGYLVINTQTGLPTASGIRHETSHTVDVAAYKLISRSDQNYILTEITPKQTSDPVNPPFYQITDGSNNTLWILATTQYGDHRSNQLKQEVYNALTQAQTLVLEYDYRNVTPDRTNLDNVNSQLIEQAKTYLYFAGYRPEIRNAAAWHNAINNHFITQGYCVSEEDSIHNAIAKIAAPGGKRIDYLDLGTHPYERTALLSSAAQELLLKDTLESIDNLEADAIRLYNMLYNGRDEEIAAMLSFDHMTDDPALIKELTDKLYTAPSKDIASTLAKYLEEGTQAFAVIDVRYLVAQNNILEQLEAMGYHVKSY